MVRAMQTIGLQPMSHTKDTMSNIVSMPQDIYVKRSDPVYMAHAYLTKVPLAAITPFISAFTKPGDVVVDPFAGSGMTGIAAALLGRRARLFDISVLGQHIGLNYVNVVDAEHLTKAARQVVEEAVRLVGDVYAVTCSRCRNEHATLSKTTWSVVVRCPGCASPVNFYRALEQAGWQNTRMLCSECEAGITSKAARIDEEAVLDSIECTCSRVQLDQSPTKPKVEPNPEGLSWPNVEIPSDRQMYQASALGKHGLTTVSSFYSTRNLVALAALHRSIGQVDDPALRSKLTFAFTAILTRASKRYQWSRKRPLNAANANYYIAPVFYEWNVFDLFLRKVDAAIRADEWLVEQHASATGKSQFEADVTYELTSAEVLPLPDDSVDYIFTDPPFGSNLFYADMALFQEGWLGTFTDHTLEAVIDRGTRKKRDGSRYEQLLTAALKECQRILRPGGYITMVFGNSSGAVWALVQRAVGAAGLVIEPGSVVILNKGQRSVKGLASGFENVATVDLILSMRQRREEDPQNEHIPSGEEVEHAVSVVLADRRADSPSHLYLELLRQGIAEGWDLSGLDLRLITHALRAQGWSVDPASGRLLQMASSL
jgi:16S rRNA G966 N2-methylase RsmD